MIDSLDSIVKPVMKWMCLTILILILIIINWLFSGFSLYYNNEKSKTVTITGNYIR
jgi:hypothetical protein